MWYIVDKDNQYINEFTTKEQAEQYCNWWNNIGRFNEWNEPIGYIIKEI